MTDEKKEEEEEEFNIREPLSVVIITKIFLINVFPDNEDSDYSFVFKSIKQPQHRSAVYGFCLRHSVISTQCIIVLSASVGCWNALTE